jgi:hypothetical protein
VFQPTYTTFDNVKVRLAGKVQFQANPDTVADGELPNDLLGQLIVDAETMVEQDLRSRYSIPFQSKSRGTWEALPDHSRRAIRVAVDMFSVMMIMKTDFGRGTHIDADSYIEMYEKEYSDYIEKLLGRDKEGAGKRHDRFRFSPPLQDMLLAPSNSEADDGYKGMIINTDANTRDAVTYAGEQINDPSKTYLRRRQVGGVAS